MSDIEKLTRAISTLSTAIVNMTKATPATNHNPVKESPDTQPDSTKDSPKQTIEPPPQSQTTTDPVQQLNQRIEAVNRMCIQKSISVANAQLLIKHALHETYEVQGIGHLKPDDIETFSQFVQNITPEDVELFLAEQTTPDSTQEATL